MSRICVVRGGTFAIDLEQVVCVSKHFDTQTCPKCGSDYDTDAATVYTKGDMDEGFTLAGAEVRALIAAWIAYRDGLEEVE